MHAIKVARLCAVCTVASVLFLFFLPGVSSRTAFAAAPIPVVAGPIPATSDSYPLDAASHSVVPQNLSQFGYVEEEYLVSGAATVYTLDSTGKAAVKTPNAPYTTRILVRRPASSQGFSGTVVVEILNSTGSYDVDYEWEFLRDYLLDHKIAWVGVTAKPIAAKALKTFDPRRYAAVSWANPLPLDKTCPQPVSILGDTTPATENGLVWDILSQVGSLVRSNSPQNPLKGFPVDKVYLIGYSQSGGYVVTYANFVRPLSSATLENGKPVYDAYFNGDGDGLYMLAPALDQCSPPPQMGDTRFLVQPRPEPMITVVSQTRVGTSFAERRPDSDSPTDRYRRYEIPGASHGSQRMADLSPTPADSEKVGVPYCRFECTEFAAYGMTDFPFEYFMAAAFSNLDAWARSGTVPPRASLMSLKKVSTAPFPVPEVDKYGNALGGLRSPYVDVPIATYFGSSTPENPAARLGCSLSGYKVPLKKSDLLELYPTHDAYVKKVSEEVDAMMKERLLTPSDGAKIKDEAARASVP